MKQTFMTDKCLEFWNGDYWNDFHSIPITYTNSADFKETYRWWHYRLAVSVAVTGVGTNLLNVITLTRPSMAAPTNLLLLGLAVADLLVVIEYIPYAASMLMGGDNLIEAREYALYIITHAHLSQVCHTVRSFYLSSAASCLPVHLSSIYSLLWLKKIFAVPCTDKTNRHKLFLKELGHSCRRLLFGWQCR